MPRQHSPSYSSSRSSRRKSSRSSSRHGLHRHRERSLSPRHLPYRPSRHSSRRDLPRRRSRSRGSETVKGASSARHAPYHARQEPKSLSKRMNFPRSSTHAPQEEPQKISKSSPEKSLEISPEKPNFSLSGKLTEELQTVGGVLLKYCEPIEAEMPDQNYCFVVFKGDTCLTTIYLNRKSFYLFGRDPVVVDVPTEHPSCSKQHAVLQYRKVQSDTDSAPCVKPYLLDIDSTNGTFLNGVQIDGARYYELCDKDLIRFGQSTREYVFMNADSI